MSKIIKTIVLLAMPMLTFGQSEDILRPYIWKNRLLMVFATSDKCLDYQKQMSIIAKASKGFAERHLIVLSIFENHGITSTHQNLDFLTCKKLYDKFKISKDDFAVVLIGKDGGEKYRKNAILTNEELFAIIDAMPMRKTEMKH
jgi:hypothetical protein